MTAKTDRRRARPREVLRALAALGALVVLVVAVPVVLVTLMEALPLDPGALAPAAWGRADDGRLLLLAIVAVAWAAWGVMVLSVGLETWAAIRRVPTPGLPGLAVPQRWAAALVASVIVALSPAAGSPATAVPGSLSAAVEMSTVVAVVTVGEDRVGVEVPHEQSHAVRDARQSLDEAPGQPAHPTVTTVRHDTLWLLAEQYLGAGERYVEIVELNRDVQQPDGRSLGEDGRIYPGWSLALPVDAVVDAERPERHRVVPGDTLWTIADEELEDGSRFTEIVDANRGDLQPDGQRLTDPNLILPGWILEIPGSEGERDGRSASKEALDEADETADPPAADNDDANDEAPASAADTADTADTADADADASSRGSVTSSAAIPPIDRARSAASATPPVATPRSTSSPSTTPSTGGVSSSATPILDRGTVDQESASAGSERVTPAPDRGAGRDETPAIISADDGAASDGLGGAAIALPAGGAVAAMLLAGVGAELVRRRRQFQRHRRPGERMPSTGPGAHQVELAARIAGTYSGPGLVERALVQLAEEAQTAGRDLPDVRLVRVSEESVILDLAAPAGPAIAPFVAGDDTRWTLSRALLPVRMPDRARALPGLVTLGFAGSETLLLNLESVGTLAIAGPETATADVLRGLAADLAFGPASGLTERTLCLADPTISEAVEAGDIAVETEPARVAAALTAVLSQPPGSDPAAEDPLLIVLCDQSLGVAVPRGSGCALITAAPVEGAGATLVVHGAGISVLLPEREQLTAQQLSGAANADVVEALRSTDLPGAGPSGSPAPAGVGREGAPAGPGEADGSPVIQASFWAVQAPAGVIDLREISSDPDRPDARMGDPAVEGLDPTEPATGPGSEVPSSTVPRVLLLGEVLVENAHGRAESTRLGRLAETTAFVLLNPGTRPSELQGALWPGRRSNPQTCRQMISRARTWLGRTDSGEPYLMTFAESAGRLRLRREVSSDWADFQRLAEIGLGDPEDTEHLTRALALVRGRPFGAVASRELPWADLHINEMISLITDVAHALALRHEEAGRRSAARDAALRGLRTE
ncbi:MAG TPA: LysM peptidoglycan-binding domain-containing protein, partial [Motilibacterales bacterium]|nr:LysM peptidoglycan-binding domain-containing protein [Motilibacterales bacterium]